MTQESIYFKKPWLANYEKGVPEHIDYENIFVADFLKRSALDFPQNTALIFQGYKLTFAKLEEMVSCFAGYLNSIGIRKGDAVAILLPNVIPCVAAYYAIMKIGAIAVMNNPLYSDRELEHQFNDSNSKILITLDLLANRMVNLRPKTKIKEIIYTSIGDYLPFPKNLLFPLAAKKRELEIKKNRAALEKFEVEIKEIKSKADFEKLEAEIKEVKNKLEKNTKLAAKVNQADKVYKWKEVLSKNYPEPLPAKLSFDDTAMYQYTGGTTGVSKGAELTHGNLSKNIQQSKSWFQGFEKGENVLLGALPFFHSFGLTCCMNFAMYMGWTNVLVPKPNSEALLEAIGKFKPTFAPLVPTMYIGLVEHPNIESYDMSSIKGCFSGSASLPVKVIEKFEAKTGAIIAEGYGLTESTPVAHINPFGKGKRKVGSIGVPLPDTITRIVDLKDGETDVPAGEIGEIIMKGPQIMKGYLNRPDETAKTLKDGWLYTGDIGTMDEDGYFYIVGRKKNMIISGGLNVYPKEIEEVFSKHPKIVETAVVGIPHATRGEAVKLFAVLRKGEKATQEEMIEYSKDKLAKYKWPVEVEFMAELPKTNVGKVLKRALRKENN